ncbi:MAG: hypothetical protein JWO72_2955 [Caulobacteraceae bacterium]|jgi:hypothetical protein|nr:hypothetical protein [Caulobacteraceae bacterium]
MAIFSSIHDFRSVHDAASRRLPAQAERMAHGARVGALDRRLAHGRRWQARLPLVGQLVGPVAMISSEPGLWPIGDPRLACTRRTS